VHSKLFCVCAALGLWLPLSGVAKTVSVRSAAGIMARLDDASGHYEIIWRKVDWKFSGDLGAAVKADIHRGEDHAGAFHEIQFAFNSFSGGIRVYDNRAAALFTWTNNNQAGETFPTFPQFTSFPAGLHHFSFHESAFAPPRFDLEHNGTPWLLFDDRANAALLSPADDFMVARMEGDGVHEIASGLNEGARDLPAHFSHGTLLAFAPGIRAAWQTWSGAFLALQGRSIPANDADIGLRYLGYWTDNGAVYYYNYDTNFGYAGTLEKLVARYRDEKIPIRYLQLDSWWYEKTLAGTDGRVGRTKNPKLPAGEWNRYGGLLKYEADPAVLPGGLSGLHQDTGLPLITHNRWIDPASPYHEHYKISGIAAVDPKWWDHIMADIASGGVVCYEQDWLSEIYYHSPEFQTTPGVGAAFADNMARAAREHGLSLQYCMALPRFFLQGAREPNLTTIRVSDDRFKRARWDSFLYVSQLANAVGIWPWVDVFMSTETNNLLLADLSAGMVGIGDAIGHEDRDNLLRVARADGVLVKPDAPLLPLDEVYVAQAEGKKVPMIAWTHSDHGALRTAYVFAYNRQNTDSETGFTSAAFGLKGNVCVLDTRSGVAQFQPAEKHVTIPLERDGTAYYEVAPVGKSGLAFFGDADKFVSNGRQRIALLKDARGKLTATITFAAGEKSVRVFGYASKVPKITARSGAVGDSSFDAQTGRFSVEVTPAPAVTHSGPDEVQTAVVEFASR
jgi:hypothetical protein